MVENIYMQYGKGFVGIIGVTMKLRPVQIWSNNLPV